MKKIVMTLALLALATVVAVPTFIYSGLFNVAATWEDPRPVAWLLHSTYSNSVAARANDIQVPENLGSREQVLQGARTSWRCAAAATRRQDYPKPRAALA